MKRIQSLIRNVCSFIWSLFLNGLFTILPLTITIALFTFSIRLLITLLEPLRTCHPSFCYVVPHSEIIITILIVLIIGFIMRFFLLQKLLHLFERLLFKIPLVRPVYGGIKQLIRAMDPHSTTTFQQVVMIEFPRAGTYSLGFLTGDLPQEIVPEHKEQLCSVFIPTTPNPTTGFYIMAQKKDIKITSLTREEATTLIISGGLVIPDRKEDDNFL